MLARTYAERAKAQYEELTDRVNVGKLLNNLGGLEFLLGKPDEAIARLNEAFAVALEHGDDIDVATAISSLAQVHLRTGDPVKAEEHARHALELLGGREDRMDEIGNARLVLGRALLEQGRLDEAEAAARRGRGRARAALVWPAPRRGLGRPRRSRAAPRGRPPRRHPLPSRRRGAPGLQVLEPREEVKSVATMLALLVSRRRLLLTSSPWPPRSSARSRSSFHLAGFFDGPPRPARFGRRTFASASGSGPHRHRCTTRSDSSELSSPQATSALCWERRLRGRALLVSQRCRVAGGPDSRRYSGADGDVAAAPARRSRSRARTFRRIALRMC